MIGVLVTFTQTDKFDRSTVAKIAERRTRKVRRHARPSLQELHAR